MPGFAARPYTSRLSGWCSTIRCIYLVQGYQVDERGRDSKGGRLRDKAEDVATLFCGLPEMKVELIQVTD